MANKVGLVAMLVGIALALGPLPLGGALIMVTGSLGLAISWERALPDPQLLRERQSQGEVTRRIGPELDRFEAR
jgi:hypothetical protein